MYNAAKLSADVEGRVKLTIVIFGVNYNYNFIVPPNSRMFETLLAG